MPTTRSALRGQMLYSGHTGHPILFYTLRLGGRLLEVAWQPGLTTAEALEGIRFVFDTLVENHTEAFLVDTSGNDSLDWSELVPTLQYEEYPRALAAGLRCQASVLAFNPNDALAHHSLHLELDGKLPNGLFHQATTARAWLLEMMGKMDT